MILVTGGAGYIGSHTVKKLLEENFEVFVIDNLSRGHIESVPESVKFERVDLCSYSCLIDVLKKYSIDAVIHFAAFLYVEESVKNPLLYYNNNVVGSLNLIRAVKEIGINKFVFSSTCAVYGTPDSIPIQEIESTKPINPYGRTKLIIENILNDFNNAYGMKYVALRYFNAAGASDDSSIGESHDPEPHLIPLVLYTALGKRDKVLIYGNDYPTKDGTCIRDYIHVNDLADAHIKALNYLEKGGESTEINIGTGIGYSVKEIINDANEITASEIKNEIVERRTGDPAILIADNKKALDVLGWVPKYDLKGIIETAWKWHKDQKY